MAGSNTPMMQQYLQIKSEHEGFLLFYRMGDFYEMFGDDAVVASQVLQITLTRRRSSKEEEGMPMCGVPFHAAEGYIAKLLENGYKVALCEQTETPEQAKKRGGYKALVKREVVRMYTGGTLTEDSMLQAESNNYLAAIMNSGVDYSLAWLDLSTGEFYVSPTGKNTLPAMLSQLSPGEILVAEHTAQELADILKPYSITTESSFFNHGRSEVRLKEVFNMASLEALGLVQRGLTTAAGALLQYAELTQMGKLPALRRPQVIRNGQFLHIDESSRRNLELTQTLQGQKKGSLFNAINRTVTPAGGRALHQWVNSPLTSVDEIGKRQDVIEFFLNSVTIREDVRSFLKQTADMSRALSRLTLGRGGPRDLNAVRQTISQVPLLASKLGELPPALLGELVENMQGYESLEELLTKAMETDNLPMLARDGGFIKQGFCPKLDEYKAMAKGGMDMLKALEAREAERTGISTLRIKYNKVWGYFLEITKSHADKVPDDYIHRQTTTNAQRFTTSTLMELEQNFSAAETNSLERERELFDQLVKAVCEQAHGLLKVAESLGHIDALCSGAVLATEQSHVRPVVDNSTDFVIKAGKHPVVEQTVENFIANSTDLSGNQLWLITGPNMAGKSTFLRQNALITIMAQMGYFVPAKSAKIGVVDKIFTRIGAADDLARGQSTFMVEMVETATILNNATNRSLVILDEIGRGTATYDGLSIAWGCVEHLVAVNKSRGLFATHYHELTDLADMQPNLSCHHVAVKEWESDIIFLHKVKDGTAPRSYGIHVGKLAGLPESVVSRAEVVLEGLEKSSATAKGGASVADLPLFTSPAISQPIINEVVQPSQVEDKLKQIDIDNLTPREAMDILYSLKSEL